MSEVPPSTRRARKDVPLVSGAPVDPERPDAVGTPSASVGAPPALIPAASTGPRPRADTALHPGALDPDDDPERLPTAQLEMAAFGDHLVPYVAPAPPKPPSFAPWALGVAILALAAALFTGWLVVVGVIAVVLAVVSLRRRHDSRGVAGWALALALLSIAFSAGWLIWGFSQLAVA